MSALIKAERGLSSDEIELIKTTIAKGATDTELKLFIAQCNRTGLDPFSRQIYAIKRWDSQLNREIMSFQTSIDGLRLIAQRTGDYDGQDAPEWKGHGNQYGWTEIWEEDRPPFAARVRVYRKGVSRPFVGIAKYDAYVQTKKDKTPNTFWAKMPDHMLAKIAEALAIRKAFPQETSGIYTREEMGDDESTPMISKPIETIKEPVTFTKKSAAPSPAELTPTAIAADTGGSAAVADSPAVPGDDCIGKGLAANFHRHFRDNLAPEYRDDEDEISHTWLAAEGIKDVIGKPSAYGIKKEAYYDVRDRAAAFARKYKR